MSKPPTPCFVRVENPTERKELIEWLESVGQEPWFSFSANKEAIVHADRDKFVCMSEAIIKPGQEQLNIYHNDIDCGTNIALFKALAAMNDSNDWEQWYYCLVTLEISAEGFEGAEPTICWSGTIAHRDDDRVFDLKHWRKATAEEIIKHFKK